MKNYRLTMVGAAGVLLLANLVGGCATTGASATNDDEQIRTVITGIMRTAASVRSAKGQVKVYDWRKHQYGRVGESEITYKLAVEGSVLGDQRYRSERTAILIKNGPDSRAENPKKLKLIEPGHMDAEISSFDGQKLIHYDAKAKRAHIEPRKTKYPLAADLPYVMNVDGMLLNMPGTHTFSDGLTVETKASILRNESVKGSDCAVLEIVQKQTAPGSKKPCETVSILWADTNKGYAVTKLQDYNVVSGSRVMTREVNTDLKDYGNGLWKPSKCVIEGVELGQDGARVSTYKQVVTYDPKFQINCKITEDELTIKLPKGTLVEDKVLNKTYKVK